MITTEKGNMPLQETKTSLKGYKGGSKGKPVYAQVEIWREGDIIHIRIPKEKHFHTSVNNKEGTLCCHKNLYNKLRRLLRENGCWD